MSLHLRTLFLKNFRNFRETLLNFSPELNLIQGNNGQGKTNLLEAIYFLSTGRSFRTQHLKELIHKEASFFYIEADFIKEGVPQKIKVTFNGTTRLLEYNQTTYSSFIPLLGLLPLILYAPEDSNLITGSPLERRRLLDLHLAQHDPLYIHHLQRYYRALKQRNFLLRQRTELGIGIWEELMALASAYLLERRAKIVDALKPLLEKRIEKLSLGRDRVEIHYKSTLSPPFLSHFQRERPREISTGTTLAGPHRDDLLIHLNGDLARRFASEGQKRSLVAALRFAQWESLHSLVREPPLLLIDDFGVHLDSERYTAFQEDVEQRGQVFLTSPSFHHTLPTSAQKHYLTISQGGCE
jgi:DNA replication and repair protein RecF